MRLVFLFAATLLKAQPVVPVDPALTEIANTHRFLETAISPDGAHLAYVEAMSAPNQSAIYIAPRVRVTSGDGKVACDEHSLAWSADGKQLAFLSDCAKKEQLELYVTPAEGGAARQLTHLKGLLAEPKWSPDGKRIAILFTENLPHAAGPLDPVPPDSGVLESQIFEQRLTLADVPTGVAHQLTPKDMYVYEYDWSPDGHGFAATAAPGDGDANWWTAQLYTVAGESGEMKSIYKPPVELQIATPRFAPDGKSVVFIGGLMSDEGSTGGDVFQVSAAGGAAKNLTRGMAASASNITWPKNSRYLFFTEHHDGGSAVSQLDPTTGQTERLWQGDESINPPFFDAGKKYPMVVAVHGGPASSVKPNWPRPGYNPALLSQQGYFVLMPNPRGSYGQGEKFASANVRDFGGGDLRDILAGVDEAVRTAPVDPQRIGITGWSYGGFMTMFAVTQTNRFKAAVAGAGWHAMMCRASAWRAWLWIAGGKGRDLAGNFCSRRADAARWPRRGLGGA